MLRASALLLCTVPLTAGAETAPSVYTLNGYLDEDGTWATDVGTDIEVGRGFRLLGSIGLSSIDAEPRAANDEADDLRFVYGDAGLGWSSGALQSDLTVGRWGDSDAVATTDVRASVGYVGERLLMQINGVYRDIDLRIRRVVVGEGLVEEDFSTPATAIGIAVNAAVTADWWLYAGGEVADYRERIERLAPRIPLRLLSQRQISLAGAFPAWSWNTGMDLYLGTHRLNLEYAADRSIFGAVDSRAASAAWELPLRPDGSFSLTLRVGHADSEGAESAVFGGLSLTLLH